MATPATGALIGTPASISASDEPHTEAIEVDPFDSRMSETTRIVYGNLSRVRDHRHERPLGERAVTDVAALGAAHSRPPHRERREVVVVQVALGLLQAERVEPHLVTRGAERCHREGLRLAAGEHRGAVRARCHPTSIQMSRSSSAARPSGRFFSTAMRLRTMSFSSLSKASWTWRGVL